MAIPDKFFVCIHDYERWYSLLTLEEFDKLSEEERRERYKELSAEDRYFVRLHQAPGAIYSFKKNSPKEALEQIEEEEQFLKSIGWDIDFGSSKEYWRKRLEEEKT